MMKKNFLKLLPYLLILLFSIVGTYIVFYKGVVTGDDIYFHLGNIKDQYQSILDGKGFSSISGNLAMGIGVGNRLFYSPLAHLTVSILTIFLKLFGVSMLDSYKIVIVLSVFVSGIFMYRFALKFTMDNKIASLISAVCYVLYPYRMFDAFCRAAFAEAYSFIFIPLFFNGLYCITHFKDKITVLPFVKVILGGSLLYLSHNITALYTYLAGIIYLLINIKGIIKSIKFKKYIPYCLSSIFLLIGIASIILFSQFELLNMNYYNLSDEVKMWTNIEKIITRTSEEFNYSGFINVPYLIARYPSIYSWTTVLINIFMYLLTAAIFIVLDRTLSEIKLFKNLHLLPSIIAAYGMISLINPELETYLGLSVFIIIYIYVLYMFNKENNDDNQTQIYHNNMFWYCILITVLCFFMMESEWIWTVVPKLMRNIQFPWRLWALIQLCISIIFGLIIYHYSFKKVASFTLSIFVGLFVVTSMPLIEKRMLITYGEPDKIIMQEEDRLLDNGITLGFNKEYIPMVLTDKTYQSKYTNSLYYYFKNKISGSFYNYDDYSVEPVFILGNGDIEIDYAFAPNYQMKVNVESDSIIQMPLIYYPGYEISINDKDNNEITTLKPDEIDGFVSFELSKGNYEIIIDYKGSSINKVSKVIFTISLSMTLLAMIYGIIIENDKYKKNLVKGRK